MTFIDFCIFRIILWFWTFILQKQSNVHCALHYKQYSILDVISVQVHTHTTSPCTRLPAFTFPQNLIHNTNMIHFQPMIVSTRNDMKIGIRGGAIYTVKYISIFHHFVPIEMCTYLLSIKGRSNNHPPI